jgi:hypothetical protein
MLDSPQETVDHYTRRVFGFGIHAGIVNGEALCLSFLETSSAL